MRRVPSLFLLFLSGFLYAQDIHFSQFNASPMNLNPALTGMFDGEYRFAGNHRNQWLAIPVPYKTYSMSADMKLPYKIGKNTVGAGIIINTDKAGDSGFGTNQAALALSYVHKLNKQATQLLSLGFQAGISAKYFNAGKLTFDNQYNGDAYDPGISSIENFSTTRINYFDASLGVNWLYKIRQRTLINIGSAVFHISGPRQSFFNDNNIKLDRKLIQHGIFQINLNPGMDLISSVLFASQGKFSELVAGTSLKYFLRSKVSLGTAIYLGTYYRAKDAVILTSGLDYDNFTFGISYDINVSGFTPATNHRGGFEFSLIYIIQKFRPLKSGSVNCPVFM